VSPWWLNQRNRKLVKLAIVKAGLSLVRVAGVHIVTSDLPEWNQDPGLLDWLASL
jgi:hypothetical protein